MLLSNFQHLVYVQDTQDDYQAQITFTDRLQTTLDEMVELAMKKGASLSEVNMIKRKRGSQATSTTDITCTTAGIALVVSSDEGYDY